MDYDEVLRSDLEKREFEKKIVKDSEYSKMLNELNQKDIEIKRLKQELVKTHREERPNPPVQATPTSAMNDGNARPKRRLSIILFLLVILIVLVGLAIYASDSKKKDEGRVSWDYSVDGWTEDVTIRGYVDGKSRPITVTLTYIVHDYSPACPSDPAYRVYIEIGRIESEEQRDFDRTFDLPIYDSRYVSVELYSVDWQYVE